MPRKTRVSKKTAAEESDVDGDARASTEEMAKEGASLETQVAKIKLYCQLHDLRLIKIVVDPGSPQRASTGPASRKYSTICVADGPAGWLSRNSIDSPAILGDWVWLIEHFFNDRANCRLHSVADSIDTRTAAGRMVLNLLVTIAQWERETIGERTSDTLQGKIARGERCGKIRYGYALDESGPRNPKTGRPVKLVPIPHEQEVIKRMKEWAGPRDTPIPSSSPCSNSSASKPSPGAACGCRPPSIAS